MTSAVPSIEQPSRPTLETSELRTPDGLKLHVETIGQGPSMLLLNGMFCSTHYYPRWLEHFAPHFRIVQWDYRGHGKSDDPRNMAEISVEKFADDARHVLENTCKGKVIVVGHSMGVRVALELFKRMPDRIACLVLLCGSAWDSLGPLAETLRVTRIVLSVLRFGYRAAPLARWLRDKVIASNLVIRVGYMVGGLSRELTPPEPIEQLLANLQRLDIRLIPVLATSFIRHSARDLLDQVDVPAIFFVGEKDIMAPPSHAKKVVRKLARGELYVVPGCTHLAHIERPDEVHAAVDSFLARARQNP